MGGVEGHKVGSESTGKHVEEERRPGHQKRAISEGVKWTNFSVEKNLDHLVNDEKKKSQRVGGAVGSAELVRRRMMKGENRGGESQEYQKKEDKNNVRGGEEHSVDSKRVYGRMVPSTPGTAVNSADTERKTTRFTEMCGCFK